MKHIVALSSILISVSLLICSKWVAPETAKTGNLDELLRDILRYQNTRRRQIESFQIELRQIIWSYLSLQVAKFIHLSLT